MSEPPKAVDPRPPPRAATCSIVDLAWLLSSKLLKNSTLKIYEKFPHGMCTTHADVVNPALLAFIKS